jgi:hypothetical protein
MPFVLEDYYPNCATVGYKAAVESAMSDLPNTQVRDGDPDQPTT